MSYTIEYMKLVESEEPYSKTAIATRNLYKLTAYKYADGTKKNLRGQNAPIIFVIGKDAENIYCVKLNEVLPNKFIQWASSAAAKNIKIEDVKELDEIIIKSDKQGKKLFNTFIKNKTIYHDQKKESTYRVYKIKGISGIYQLNLKPEIFKKIAKVQ